MSSRPPRTPRLPEEPRDQRDVRRQDDPRDPRDELRESDRQDRERRARNTLRLVTISVACLAVAVFIAGALFALRQHDLNNIQKRFQITALQHEAEDQRNFRAFCEYLEVSRPFNPKLAQASMKLAQAIGCPN